MKKVGVFTIEKGCVTGPARYMRERGNDLIDKIGRGDDTLLNNTAYLSPDLETAVLVRLQTDYAGWLGMVLTAAELSRGNRQ